MNPKWSYQQHLLKESAEKFLQDSVPGASNVDLTSWDPEFGANVVRMTLTRHASFEFAKDVRKGLEDMKYISLQYDMVDKGKHVSK